jgi:hypothetical protein
VVGEEPARKEEIMKSWKPEFLVGGKWCGNAVRFASEAEALANAQHKMARWAMPEACRAVQAEEEPNYAWKGELVAL